MPHHIVYVATPHGFGHAAIITSVMAAMAGLFPDIRQTVVTTVPEAVLRERLPAAYDVVRYQCPTDFGMKMDSTTHVNHRKTVAAYCSAHADLRFALQGWKSLFAELRPSLIVSSASYTAVAAGADSGVPAVTIGPFLWHDILQAYAPLEQDLLSEIATHYRRAAAFLLPTPSVTPTVIGPQQYWLGPVGMGGVDQRPRLIRAGGLQAGEQIVFASLGGMHEAVPYAQWQCPAGWRLLTQADGQQHGIRVSDLIASATAIVTKPGYGTYVEAGLAGARLISRARPDWPESEGLLRWFRDQGLPVDEVPEESFAAPGPLSVLRRTQQTHSRLSGVSTAFGTLSSGAIDCATLLVERFL